jgi:GTP-binding protein
MMEKLAPATYIPILFASVLTKQRIFQVIEKAVEVYHNKTKKIPTSKLNDTLLPEIAHYPPPALKGKMINIKYITQVKAKVPTFAFFCNLPQYIQTPYERFLENKLRANFDFEGAPIRLFFRKK